MASKSIGRGIECTIHDFNSTNDRDKILCLYTQNLYRDTKDGVHITRPDVLQPLEDANAEEETEAAFLSRINFRKTPLASLPSSQREPRQSLSTNSKTAVE